MKKIGFLIVLLGLSLLMFQNCGKFEVESDLKGSDELASQVLSASTSQSVPASAGFDIIVIAGQSNAVGIGCGAYSPLEATNDHRIFQIDVDKNILPASEPLKFNRNPAGVGFGLSFARLYARSLPPHRKVLIVPTAMGGTSIVQWDQTIENVNFGGTSSIIQEDSTFLWDRLVKRTDAALQAGGGHNRIVSFLWHQGESDYMLLKKPAHPQHRLVPDVETYQDRLLSVLRSIRSKYDPSRSVPFLLGEIGGFWSGLSGEDSSGELLRALNLSIFDVAREGSNIHFIESHGLISNKMDGCKDDQSHFSAASQIELARRYYSTFSGTIFPDYTQRGLFKVGAGIYFGFDDFYCQYSSPQHLFNVWGRDVPSLIKESPSLPRGMSFAGFCGDQQGVHNFGGHFAYTYKAGYSCWLTTSKQVQELAGLSPSDLQLLPVTTPEQIGVRFVRTAAHSCGL